MPKTTPQINLEVARTYSQRAKGLIGSDRIASHPINGDADYAMLIKPAYFSIHTFGMGQDLDVAFLDASLNVCKIQTVKPNRFAGSIKSRAVLEASAGSFERWGIKIGIKLEIGQAESDSPTLVVPTSNSN